MPPYGRLAMTAKLIVIARSEATKQSLIFPSFVIIKLI
jgi:hypothetical protein